MGRNRAASRKENQAAPEPAPNSSDTKPSQKLVWGKPVDGTKQMSPAVLQHATSQQHARPQERQQNRAIVQGRNPFQDKGVHLVTNMYALNESKVSAIANKVYRYEMDVFKAGAVQSEPASTSTNLERALVFAMKLLPHFKAATFMTDGHKILYSLQQLEKLNNAVEVNSMCSPKSESSPAPSKSELYDKVDCGDVVCVEVQHPVSKRKYIVKLRPAAWNPNDAIQKCQMLQVSIKYSFYQKNQSVILRGKNLFNKEEFVRLGDLILFTGVFQSCRFNGYSKPIINVDLSYAAAVNSSISIDQWLIEYAKHCKFRSFDEAMRNKRFGDGLQYYIKGLLAEVTYGNKATYRLEGLEEQLTPTTAKFVDKDGKETTLKTFGDETRYKTSLNKNGYLLIVKQSLKGADRASKKKQASGNRITYPKLCKFTAGQKRKADLDARETSEMINHTRKLPADRFSIIDKKVREIVQNLGAQNMDLGLDSKNIEINARVLKPKPIVYKEETLLPVNGGWEISKLYSTPQAPVTVGIVVDESMAKPIYDVFVQRFVQICNSALFPVQPPVALRVVKPETFETILRKHAKNFSFFICVLPPRMANDLYPKIKALTCVELGVITQCVLDDQYKKKGVDWVKIHDISVIKNLVASVNAKMDQENCIVAEPEMQAILYPISPSDVIVLGLDVYHGDTSDPEGKPSIVALCASRNYHFNRYATVLRSQHPNQELVVDKGVDILSEMIKEVMQARAGSLPKHVFFYRDGVGEGMYPAVLEQEVHTLQLRLAEMYFEQKLEAPKLTFVITQKRNHFRTRDGSSRDGNPPPGSLIDDMMVIDEDFPNFYLYSHKALAGTARPTHYHVLCDENKFAKDQIASFTYALTHLHQGCTKTVSIPAPVYYADLACYLAGSCFRHQVAQLDRKVKMTPFMI